MTLWSVRPLAFGEVEDAVRLWREAGLLRPWNDPRADIAAALGCSSATIFAAADGADVIGTVMAGYDGHRGWLYYLTVTSRWRGHGVGRALVAAAEDWLGAAGAPKVQLMVRQDNADAATFYERIGYQRQAVAVYGRPIGR